MINRYVTLLVGLRNILFLNEKIVLDTDISQSISERTYQFIGDLGKGPII